MKLIKGIKSLFAKKDEPEGRLKKYHDEDWHTPKGRQIREVVFGMNDGLVSTVGFIAGVTGALGESRLVFLSGMAAITAGAVSMFIGAYMASKSQKEFFEDQYCKFAD